MEATTLPFGAWELRARRPGGLGLVVEGVTDPRAPPDYLHAILLAPRHREAFFALIEGEGLVICKAIPATHPTYRPVRGRSSRGRLSQAEYYHHDGCSGPKKPRVVEIRCPYQPVGRQIDTAIARFPATVIAMLRALPETVTDPRELDRFAEIGEADPRSRAEWDHLQGAITRVVRRELAAEGARAYFRRVDLRAGAYSAPWELGESRFIANANAGGTLQHRRAYRAAVGTGPPGGTLLKRWPAEEL